MNCQFTEPLLWKKISIYLTNKKTQAVYYTVIKHDGHLITRGKCRKHEPQVSCFYISQAFSNVRSVVSQCNYTVQVTLASSFAL